MPAVTATAPGKSILFGEHAVVYGRPAIAVPVSQVKAEVVVAPPASPRGGKIHLSAPQIALSADLEDLPADDPLAAAVAGTLRELSVPAPPPMDIRISSTIPIAGGLGSGAAVSVALIRALSAYLEVPLADEAVSAIAFEVEKIHHGTPSGIDNTVITYRKPVFYIRGQPIEAVRLKSGFTLIIGDTGIASPTSLAVGDVRAGWSRDPAFFEARFDEIGRLTREALRQMEAGRVERLGPLMDQNHSLLQEIGVSSPELDRLCLAARVAGSWGAKLSGAGRGGNMIAITPAGGAQAVASALENAGAARVLITRVGAAQEAPRDP